MEQGTLTIILVLIALLVGGVLFTNFYTNVRGLDTGQLYTTGSGEVDNGDFYVNLDISWRGRDNIQITAINVYENATATTPLTVNIRPTLPITIEAGGMTTVTITGNLGAGVNSATIYVELTLQDANGNTETKMVKVDLW